MPPPLPDYYLGAIVTRMASDGAVEIYDGLQRITTLTILMAVLRDTADDGELKKRLDRLINISSGKPRVLLPTRDWTLANEIQKWGEAARSRRSAPFSDFQARVREAARTFRAATSAWTPEERASFTAFLLSNVALVIVEAANGRLARQIFVTTNLRGLPLNQADLFKGQVMDLAPDENVAQEMELNWTKVQLSVGDDLVAFLTAIDFITRRREQSADCLQELIDNLTQEVGPSGIAAWLRRLTVFATAWRHLEAKLTEPNPAVKDANIWRLSLLKWQQWKPLALLWHADFLMKSAKGTSSSSAAAHERRFAALHRRCMAMTLASISQAQRTLIFAQAIRETVKGHNSLKGALAITDVIRERVEVRLSAPFFDEDRRVILFRWLESLSWESPPPYITEGSIEHVLPQRPAPGSQWLVDFPDEDTRLDFCNSLGNFGLIDTATNGLLDNADFAVKREILSQHVGRFRTLRGLDTPMRWTAAEIEQRSHVMRDCIWKELQLSPKVLAYEHRQALSA